MIRQIGSWVKVKQKIEFEAVVHFLSYLGAVGFVVLSYLLLDSHAVPGRCLSGATFCGLMWGVESIAMALAVGWLVAVSVVVTR
jgi:hypothetical protein